MVEAVDKLEKSPSVTSARLHDTAQFDVGVTPSRGCAPAVPCFASMQRATNTTTLVAPRGHKLAPQSREALCPIQIHASQGLDGTHISYMSL